MRGIVHIEGRGASFMVAQIRGFVRCAVVIDVQCSRFAAALQMIAPLDARRAEWRRRQSRRRSQRRRRRRARPPSGRARRRRRRNAASMRVPSNLRRLPRAGRRESSGAHCAATPRRFKSTTEGVGESEINLGRCRSRTDLPVGIMPSQCVVAQTLTSGREADEEAERS